MFKRTFGVHTSKREIQGHVIKGKREIEGYVIVESLVRKVQKISLVSSPLVSFNSAMHLYYN